MWLRETCGSFPDPLFWQRRAFVSNLHPGGIRTLSRHSVEVFCGQYGRDKIATACNQSAYARIDLMCLIAEAWTAVLHTLGGTSGQTSPANSRVLLDTRRQRDFLCAAWDGMWNIDTMAMVRACVVSQNRAQCGFGGAVYDVANAIARRNDTAPKTIETIKGCVFCRQTTLVGLAQAICNGGHTKECWSMQEIAVDEPVHEADIASVSAISASCVGAQQLRFMRRAPERTERRLISSEERELLALYEVLAAGQRRILSGKRSIRTSKTEGPWEESVLDAVAAHKLTKHMGEPNQLPALGIPCAITSPGGILHLTVKPLSAVAEKRITEYDLVLVSKNGESIGIVRPEVRTVRPGDDIWAKVREYAKDYQFIDSLRELDKNTYHIVMANLDTVVVPLGKGIAGHLRAAQTRLMHAFSSRVRNHVQPVAHVCRSLYTDPSTQLMELQALRDFAWAQGMSDGVRSVLSGAHAELKSAVQGFEQMKALVVTPAIGSMHVQQQGVAVASSIVLVVPGSPHEDTVMGRRRDTVCNGEGLVDATVLAERMAGGVSAAATIVAS